MQAKNTVGVALATAVLVCVPSSAAAFSFVQPAGSPFPTTDPPFTPGPGGVLGGITSGDFNGDGISDLAVVDSAGLHVFSPGESVSILLGSRSGGLTLASGSPIDIDSGGLVSMTGAVAAGNLTKSGKLDLAVIDEINHSVSVLAGDGTGHFQPSGPSIPVSGSGTPSLAIGDFNRDGKQDVAVVDSELNVLLGDGSGGFKPAPGSPFPLSGFPTSVAAGDFNGAGRSDLAIANGSGYVTIYLSSSTGSFHVGSTLSTGADPRAIVAADLTGRGKLDLATANSGSDDVTVLLGDGSDRFTPAKGSPFPVSAGPNCPPGSESGMPESINAGDFAGNGNPDLTLANFNGCSNSVVVLQGNSTGQYIESPGSPFGANGNPRGIAAGDFNGDGKLDIATVNPFIGRVTVLQNTTEESPDTWPHQTGPTPPSNGGTNPPLSNHPPKARRIYSGSKKKSSKCLHVGHCGRHGRKTKRNYAKCAKRRASTTRRGPWLTDAQVPPVHRRA